MKTLTYHFSTTAFFFCLFKFSRYTLFLFIHAHMIGIIKENVINRNNYLVKEIGIRFLFFFSFIKIFDVLEAKLKDIR